jgi:hypothetical protein
MKKISEELLQQVLNTIVLSIHPNKSYFEINKLIQKISNLEQVNVEEKK